MRYSTMFAGAGLAQLAFGQIQVEQPFDKRDLVARATPTVTKTVTTTAKCSPTATVTKTVTVSGSTTAKSTSKTSTTSKKTTTGSTSTPTNKPPVKSGSGISKNNLTPNGIKAGLSGFVNIYYYPAFQQLAPWISWYSDYYPNTPDSNGVLGVGMLWGADGGACPSVYGDALSTFKNMTTIPAIMFGFYEPDCPCPSSSQMTVTTSSNDWNKYLAPLSAKGTALGSPPVCQQYDESFLTPFSNGINVPWDVTSVHINKPNLTQVMKVVDYFYNKYQKPIWVSEFACVHDQPTFQPCTDQTEINNFINAVVPYFQGDSRIVAFGASNGEGLGPTWPLINTTTNNLSSTGITYRNAIAKLYA